MTRSVARLLLVLAGTLVALGGVELVARLSILPPTHPRLAVHDPELGWRPRSGVEIDGRATDLAGEPHTYRYTTTMHGFREYGDPGDAVRAKVLFVGDSFTHAIVVSNVDTFPRRLAENLDIELFVLAQTGWGTLQETLAVERVIGAIQPHLVVLQVCDNDFIDNHVDLEREADYNLGLRRPYLGVDGEVRLRLPAGAAANLLARSRFGSWVVHRSLRWRRRPEGASQSAEWRIGAERDRYPRFQEAAVITSLIVDRLRTSVEAAGARLVAFGATAYEPQLSFFESICTYRGVPFSAAVPPALNRAVSRGVVVIGSDRVHWSPAGHAVVAEALRPFIEEQLVRCRPVGNQHTSDLALTVVGRR